MNADGFIEEIIHKIASPDPAVSKAALLICQDMVDARFIEPLLRQSESGNREIRKLARDMVKNIVTELGMSGDELKEMQVRVRLEVARTRLNDGDPEVRREAVEYIAVHAPETERYEPLLDRLRREASPAVITALIECLAGYQNQDFTGLLRSLLEAESSDVRFKAAHALLRQENGRYLPEVRQFMKGEEQTVQSTLAREICIDPFLVDQLGLDYHAARAVKKLFSKKFAIRQAALKDIGKIPHPDREIPLLAALADDDTSIQFLAKKMLSQTPGEAQPPAPAVPRQKPSRSRRPQKRPPRRPAETPAYVLYVSLVVLAVASGVFFWFMATGGVRVAPAAARTGSQQATGSLSAIVAETLAAGTALASGSRPEVEFQGVVKESIDRGAVLIMEAEGVMVSVSLTVAFQGEYTTGHRLAVAGTVRDITRFGGVVVEPFEIRKLK